MNNHKVFKFKNTDIQPKIHLFWPGNLQLSELSVLLMSKGKCVLYNFYNLTECGY